jgi:hypothetical protein
MSTTHVTVLGLATLYGMTEIGSFLFFVVPPKAAKASAIVIVQGVQKLTGEKLNVVWAKFSTLS